MSFHKATHFPDVLFQCCPHETGRGGKGTEEAANSDQTGDKDLFPNLSLTDNIQTVNRCSAMPLLTHSLSKKQHGIKDKNEILALALQCTTFKVQVNHCKRMPVDSFMASLEHLKRHTVIPSESNAN